MFGTSGLLRRQDLAHWSGTNLLKLWQGVIKNNPRCSKSREAQEIFHGFDIYCLKTFLQLFQNTLCSFWEYIDLSWLFPTYYSIHNIVSVGPRYPDIKQIENMIQLYIVSVHFTLKLHTHLRRGTRSEGAKHDVYNSLRSQHVAADNSCVFGRVQQAPFGYDDFNRGEAALELVENYRSYP